MKKKSKAKQVTTKSSSAKAAPKKAPQAVSKPLSKASAPVKKTAAKAKAPSRSKTPKAASKKPKVPVSGAGPMLDRVAFTLLQIEEPTRARAFYEQQLGLVRGLASPDGTWTEYDLPGGGCLALFRHPAGTFEASGGAAVAFEVTDLDAINERLQAAGVRYKGDIVKGPHCRMSNILDSEGNALILHQLD